jgi:hypothetical protein
MQTEHEWDEGRRDFLRQAARWAVALTLGGGIWALSAGRGRDCADSGLCGACAIRNGCPSRRDAPTRQDAPPAPSIKAATHE